MSNGKDGGKPLASPTPPPPGKPATPIKRGADLGEERPRAAKPPGKPATFVKAGADIRPKRPRAPRPPGSPITVQKKGIG